MSEQKTQLLLLSLPVLDSKNEYFPDWCLRMKVMLRSNGCLAGITEDPPMKQANNDEEIEYDYEYELQAYNNRDAKAMELIFRHLSPYTLNFVRECQTAKECWEMLKINYEDKSPNQLHLFDKLFRVKMNPKDDIIQHFAKFDSVVNELRSCNVTAIKDELFLISVLLKSMSSDYAIAVTAITMMSKEELKIEMVKNKLKNHSLLIENSEPVSNI